MHTEDFERLFQAHAQPLFGFLVYRTGDRTLAEDVLADAFERALRSRRSFDAARGDGKAWLYSIALNRLRDLQRRSAVESRALDQLAGEHVEEPRFEDHVINTDELRRALADLPDEEREVLALRFGGDLTVPEIAQLLEQPLSRIEGRVYRGLRKLRERSGISPPRRR
jgi:RNA polymerase sigma-70 factor (ECF subfamily)